MQGISLDTQLIFLITMVLAAGLAIAVPWIMIHRRHNAKAQSSELPSEDKGTHVKKGGDRAKS